VLAILLLHRGDVVSSERLIDELWDEHLPTTAAKTLHGYISRLRKALGLACGLDGFTADGGMSSRWRGCSLLEVCGAPVDRGTGAHSKPSHRRPEPNQQYSVAFTRMRHSRTADRATAAGRSVLVFVLRNVVGGAAVFSCGVGVWSRGDHAGRMASSDWSLSMFDNRSQLRHGGRVCRDS
jgi:hypothetical protein